MLLFDHGERRSGVPGELERLGGDVHDTRLPAGDYVVSDRLVVERKGPADLAASIKDRRLFEQLARLADAYPSVVLIVEGNPVHMQPPRGTARSAARSRSAQACCAPRTRRTPPSGSPGCTGWKASPRPGRTACPACA